MSRCQFHQRFYVRIFRTKVVSAAFSRYVLALNKLSYEKRASIMLMKLTAGVNFTNVSKAAFAHTDPKSTKKTDNFTVFFCIWNLCVQKLKKCL